MGEEKNSRERGKEQKEKTTGHSDWHNRGKKTRMSTRKAGQGEKRNIKKRK